MGMPDKKNNSTPLADRDAIDRMALSSVPLSSSTLKSARLIKNARMETMVELHNDPVSGSLQIQPEDVAEAFIGNEGDQKIINALAALHSYDVYSLRSSLKKLGIEVENSSLELSSSMKETLNGYTMEFVHPLVVRIFGEESARIDDREGLQKILRDPDVARVRENLKTIAGRTGIPLEEIPSFLESYSDVFLSVAYYRYSYDSISADIDRFLIWTRELRAHRDVSSSPNTANACKKAEETLRDVSGSIKERLARFHESFETFWRSINRASFDHLRGEIENNHTSMGSVLCGLVVKVRNWSAEFPDNTVGGPSTRAAFIMTEIAPGVEKLRLLENEARQRLGLPPMR